MLQKISVIISVTAITFATTTLTPLHQTPLAPLNLSAIKVVTPEERYVRLTWTIPSQVPGSNILGYRIYRSSWYGDLTLTPITTVGRDIDHYYDRKIPATGTYYYIVRTYDDKGEESGALRFDGVDDYVRCTLDLGRSNLSIGTEPFTVEAWVKPAYRFRIGDPARTRQTPQTVISKGLPSIWGTYGFNLYFCPWVGWTFMIGDGFTTAGYGWPIGRAPEDAPPEWTHLVGVRRPDFIELYKNGRLYKRFSAVGIGSIFNYIPLAIGVTISWWHWHPTHPAGGTIWRFTGTIDEVRIYNRALAPGEVYNNFIGTSPIITDGLIRWWKLNGTGRSTLAPEVIAGDHGNLITISPPGYPSSSEFFVSAGSCWTVGKRGNMVRIYAQENIPPERITDLQISAATHSSLTLTWTSPGDNERTGMLLSPAEFYIQYSNDRNINWDYRSAQKKISAHGINPGTPIRYTIRDLLPMVTYYIRVWTKDEAGVVSEISNMAVGYTPRDPTPPIITHQPNYTELGVLGNNIMLNISVSDYVSLVGICYKYEDEKSWKMKTTTVPITAQYTGKLIIPGNEVTREGILEYHIFAKDLSQNTSTQTYKITLKPKVELITDEKIILHDANENDGEVSIYLPPGAVEQRMKLSIEQLQTFQAPRTVHEKTIKRELLNNGLPLAVYDMKPAGFMFNNPVKITLLYLDTDDDGMIELIELENGKEIIKETNINENEVTLQIYYWSGTEWILLGGKMDKKNNTVTTNVTHIARFGIFPANDIIDESVPKQKFITSKIPAIFGMKAEEVEIYDILGRKVITLKKETDLTIKWTGKDEHGNPVESGVYIYKIKTIDKEIIYGEIIVAR